jgi:hypothetical protein
MYAPCPECDGEWNGGQDACRTCGGLGRILTGGDLDDEQMEVVKLACLIEAYGVGGALDALTVDGVRPELDPVFVEEILPVYTSELARRERKRSDKK